MLSKMAAPGKALCKDWRGLVDAFLNGNINFGFCLELIQATVNELQTQTTAILTTPLRRAIAQSN